MATVRNCFVVFWRSLQNVCIYIVWYIYVSPLMHGNSMRFFSYPKEYSLLPYICHHFTFFLCSKNYYGQFSALPSSLLIADVTSLFPLEIPRHVTPEDQPPVSFQVSFQLNSYLAFLSQDPRFSFDIFYCWCCIIMHRGFRDFG